MEIASSLEDAPPDLAVLLPGGTGSGTPHLEDAGRRLAPHWAALRDLGFRVQLRRDSLAVHHRDRAFEAVIHLSHEDDLGERRELFRALRSSFGGWVERWLPWAVQSSPAVTRPYQSLKEVIRVCQGLRRSAHT